jgi:alanyl-tRNA synthetase
MEAGQDVIMMFESDLEGNGPRELANLILAKGTKVAAVFAGTDDNYRYVIGSKTVDTRELAKTLNSKFQGRGGGKPDMVQGSITGNESCVREEVLSWVKKI